MRTASRRLLAAAQAFTLSACMLVGGDALVSPGGAEDFPNTVTALGRIAIDDISSSTQWEQAANIELPPVPDLGGVDSLRVDLPQAKFAVLGKAAIDTLDLSLWEIDLTGSKPFEAFFSGRVYAYAVDSTGSFVRRDTVVAQYLGTLGVSGMLDSAQANPGKFLLPLDYRGAVVFRATGVRQSYRLRNLDSKGDMDVGEYVTSTPLDGGGTLRKWVKIHGAEGAFRDPDPVPEEYELLRRNSAGDTLEWTLVKDADWDRRLWNDSARGVVDLFLKVRNPESQPDLQRMHVYMRAGFHYRPVLGDSLSQLQYQEQRWLRNGRIVTFTFQGTGAQGLLLPSETARMSVDTVFALRDSMIKYNAVYNLILGSSPERMQEHKLSGYAIGKFWRRGPVFSTLSAFLPTQPVPMGQADFSGAIAFTAAYVNGDTVRSTGTMSPAGLDLMVSQIKEGAVSTYQVVLDAAGNLVQVTPVAPDATATTKAGAPLPGKPAARP